MNGMTHFDLVRVHVRLLDTLDTDCPSKRDKKIGIYNGNVGPTPVCLK